MAWGRVGMSEDWLKLHNCDKFTIRKKPQQTDREKSFIIMIFTKAQRQFRIAIIRIYLFLFHPDDDNNMSSYYGESACNSRKSKVGVVHCCLRTRAPFGWARTRLAPIVYDGIFQIQNNMNGDKRISHPRSNSN